MSLVNVVNNVHWLVNNETEKSYYFHSTCLSGTHVPHFIFGRFTRIPLHASGAKLARVAYSTRVKFV
jgi:hypothetical protein